MKKLLTKLILVIIGLGLVLVPFQITKAQIIPGPSGSGGGSLPSTSLTISQSAQPATVNLTTEGTIDWLAPNGQTGLPVTLTPVAIIPSKITGGGLITFFNWIVQGGTLFTTSTTGLAMSNSAGDSLSPTDLVAQDNGQGVFKASGTGEGFRVAVVSSLLLKQKLKLYVHAFSAVITINALMPATVVAPVSTTFDTTAAAHLSKLIEIDFQGEGLLEVSVILTTNEGSTPNVTYNAITLGS